MSTKKSEFNEQILQENFIASEELRSRLPEDFLLKKDSKITIDKETFPVNIISACRFSEEERIQIDLEVENFSFLFFLENKKAKFSIGSKEDDCLLCSYFPSGSPSGGDLLIISVGDA